MIFMRTCSNCQKYGGCSWLNSNKNEQPPTKPCEHWKISFRIYQDMDEETRDKLEEAGQI